MACTSMRKVSTAAVVPRCTECLDFCTLSNCHSAWRAKCRRFSDIQGLGRFTRDHVEEKQDIFEHEEK